MPHTHRIVQCPECRKIIEQCRCSEPGKTIVFRVCPECAAELQRQQEPYRGGCRSCDD